MIRDVNDNKKKKVYINEINPCPGSLAFYLWEPTGKSFTTLLDDMISVGVKDYKRRVNKVHSFTTNILSVTVDLRVQKD